MKALGIDYGSKRVGVALSDDDGRIAFPHVVFDTTDSLVKSISDLCKEKKVDVIIIGHSIDHGGKENPIMNDIYEFQKKLLSVLDIPINLEPEFLTTSHARTENVETVMLDAAAAALILQRYLDRYNSQ